jgi:hypothetical protein
MNDSLMLYGAYGCNGGTIDVFDLQLAQENGKQNKVRRPRSGKNRARGESTGAKRRRKEVRKACALLVATNRRRSNACDGWCLPSADRARGSHPNFYTVMTPLPFRGSPSLREAWRETRAVRFGCSLRSYRGCPSANGKLLFDVAATVAKQKKE